MTDPAFEPKPRPCWIAGQPEQGIGERTVTHPFDGTEVATIAVPGPEQVARAVAAAHSVAAEFRTSTPDRRAEALRHVADAIADRAEEIAETITAENGKPLKWADVEVVRAVATFRFAAEEARRFTGELQRLDTETADDGRLALVRRRPRGPVLAISPFNFPLTQMAQKVAAALAVGAPVVMKPASSTPLSSLLLGEILAETELPAGAFSVLPLGSKEMHALVIDERLPVISFSGSTSVGWSLLDSAPRKHVLLELGDSAAAVVCADWSSEADLDYAARQIATYANYQGGQSRIAVQRVLVHAEVAPRFLPKLVAAVEAVRTGDPHDPAVDVGPLITTGDARRVETWVSDAVSAGARLLTGGGRDGATVEPTVLTEVPSTVSVWRDEVFGPVVSVSTVDSEAEAFAAVNDSAAGSQAGVFTHDLRTAFRASAELAAGGVIIGDVPSYRADQLPYGGVRGSGAGREGVRSAMDDFTEEHVLVLTGITA